MNTSQHWSGILPGDARVESILDIIVQEAKVDRAVLRLDAEVTSVGITSLDITLIVCEVENRFQIDIATLPEFVPQTRLTVGDLVAHALNYIPQDAAPASGTSAPPPRSIDNEGA